MSKSTDIVNKLLEAGDAKDFMMSQTPLVDYEITCGGNSFEESHAQTIRAPRGLTPRQARFMVGAYEPLDSVQVEEVYQGIPSYYKMPDEAEMVEWENAELYEPGLLDPGELE